MRPSPNGLDLLARHVILAAEEDLRRSLRDVRLDPELLGTLYLRVREVLERSELDDAATADELFSVLMGDDVEARRSFIVRNAKDVRFLDI